MNSDKNDEVPKLKVHFRIENYNKFKRLLRKPIQFDKMKENLKIFNQTQNELIIINDEMKNDLSQIKAQKIKKIRILDGNSNDNCSQSSRGRIKVLPEDTSMQFEQTLKHQQNGTQESASNNNGNLLKQNEIKEDQQSNLPEENLFLIDLREEQNEFKKNEKVPISEIEKHQINLQIENSQVGKFKNKSLNQIENENEIPLELPKRKCKKKIEDNSSSSSHSVNISPKPVKKKIVKKKVQPKNQIRLTQVQTRSQRIMMGLPLKDQADSLSQIIDNVKKKKKTVQNTSEESKDLQASKPSVPFGNTYQYIEECQKQLIAENLLLQLKSYSLSENIGIFGKDNALKIDAHIMGITEVDQTVQLYFKVDFEKRLDGIIPKSIWINKQEAIKNCKDLLFQYMLDVCIWPPPQVLQL